MKKPLLVFLAVAIVAVTVGAVAAVTLRSFNQNLTVPLQKDMQVYQGDGTTVIADGSDQTALWTWDVSNTRFWAMIQVENKSNAPIAITLTPTNLGGGWTLSTPSSLTGINPGEKQAITLYVTNPGASGGSNTGTFTVSVAIV